MMVMTAKVNIKKVLIGLVAAVALILAIIALFGKNDENNAVSTMSDNDNRVQFLESQGWQVITSPKESSQVKIPTEMTPVYSRYNDLQKSQGYDLSRYAGKNVMRYVYKVNNYPDAVDPVYATVLVYKNQVIGGDITDTSAGGKVQGFKKNQEKKPAVPTETASAST